MAVFASPTWMLNDKNFYVLLMCVSHVYAGEIEHLVLHLLDICISSSLSVLSFSVCNGLKKFF